MRRNKKVIKEGRCYYSDNRNYCIPCDTLEIGLSFYNSLKTLVRLGIEKDTPEYRRFIQEFEVEVINNKKLMRDKQC